MSTIRAAQEFAKKIRAYVIDLASSDLESALKIANIYGRFLKLNHIGIYADIELENFLAQRLAYVSYYLHRNEKFDTLHLMTTALTHGGHTRVVEKFLLGGLGTGLAALDKIPNMVLESIPTDIVIYDKIRQKTSIETIKSIVNVGLNYKNIILHIHQDDILSAVASVLLRNLGVRIYFYNHSDHTFSFGFSAAENIFEISKLGWDLGESRGVKDKQSFVGIPIAKAPLTKNLAEKKNNININGLVVGSAWKFKPFGQIDIVIFLNLLFQSDRKCKNVNITICGPTGKEKYWSKLDESARSHVEFAGTLPFNIYRKKLMDSDFYIDSFPMGNGTAFVEPIMLGIPAFGLSMLSGSTYADILRSNSISELANSLVSYFENKQIALEKTLAARDLVIREQSVEACIARIEKVLNLEKITLLPLELMNMKYSDGFFEDIQKESKIIYFHFEQIKQLNIMQRVKLFVMWRDAWPYRTSFSFITRGLTFPVRLIYRSLVALKK